VQPAGAAVFLVKPSNEEPVVPTVATTSTTSTTTRTAAVTPAPLP
jgi:hypothetical protein